MEAPHILIVYGQVKYGNRTAIVTEYRLPAVSFDDLPHQMQSQNVGRVVVGTGA